MLRQIILLLISVSVLSQSSTVSRPTPYDEDEAYKVYAAILPLEWPIREVHAKSLVIRAETRGYKMCLKPRNESEKIFDPVISEYIKLNEKPRLLQRKFGIELPYKLIPTEELNRGGDYPESGGWIELSAVGFNADKTLAVVYMGHHCGGLCGGGEFHVLQKKDGQWLSIEWRGESCGWVS